MRVIVKSDEVVVKEGVSAKNGRPYRIVEQPVTAETEDFKQRAKIQLPDNAKPYPPGEYTVDFDKSVRVGSFGELRFGDIVLVPVKRA